MVYRKGISRMKFRHHHCCLHMNLQLRLCVAVMNVSVSQVRLIARF